ncbi:MAG: FKBP-type peptidyl-prolyl cis-trans isomerase [Nanobdellota archaeon]
MKNQKGEFTMSAIKKHDFIEIDFTGTVQEDGMVFDTTKKEIAQEHGLDDGSKPFEPLVICVGEGHVLPGIDEFLEGKDLGEYELEIPPEKGFGKRNASYIQLVPTSKFKKQGIQPQPGMQVNVDDSMGIVKTVSGGRTIVDFNHPFTGRSLHYAIEVKQIITDPQKQISSLLSVKYGVSQIGVDVTEGVCTLTFKQELPEEIREELKKEIMRLVSVNDVVFAVEGQKQDVATESPKQVEADKHAEVSHDKPKEVSHTKPKEVSHDKHEELN